MYTSLILTKKNKTIYNTKITLHRFIYGQLCRFKTKYAQFVFVLDFMLSYNTAVAFKRYVPEQTNPHPIQEVLDRNQLAFGIQRGLTRPNVDFWA